MKNIMIPSTNIIIIKNNIIIDNDKTINALRATAAVFSGPIIGD